MSVTSTFTTNLTFTRKQTLSNRVLNDQAESSSSASFANGTGVAQNDFGHQESGLLTAGGSKRINFSNLQQNILGGTQTVDLDGAKLKSIVVINNSSNGIFTTEASGGLGFKEPFNGSDGALKLNPDGFFSFLSYSGVAVSNGHSLWLNDAGGGSSFILGLTAVTG